MATKTNAQVALESASRLYADKSGTGERSVLAAAEKFLTWLDAQELDKKGPA